MVLAVLRDWVRQGKVPPRDVVFAFVADEEAGGTYGAHFLVDNHADLFEGCTEAVSEVGGYSMTIGGQRLYAIQTAEKGISWLRLVANGRAGHGSMLNDDNAVTALAEAVARVGRHTFPIELSATVEEFLREICDGARHPVLRRRHRGHPRQARSAGEDDRRDRPPHRQPDHARGRLQAERDPGGCVRLSRRSLPAGRRGAVPRGDRAAGRAGGRGRGRAAPDRVRDDLRRRPGRGDVGGDRWPRTPTAGWCRTACPAARMRSRSPSSACAASATRRCCCRPTWTSWGCSTASTSECRSTGCSSACGRSVGSWRTARSVRGRYLLHRLNVERTRMIRRRSTTRRRPSG